MEQTSLGRIEVSPTAIATLVAHAVVGCYGVVGMATKDLASGIVEVLQPNTRRRGIDIHINDLIAIDVYVVIEYGTRVAMVAQNIQSAVTYTVEKALGVPVHAVNVHVQDLRASSK